MPTERVAPTLILAPDTPPVPVIVSERAFLDCGCQALIGLRVDRLPPEETTVAYACDEDHAPLTAHFCLLLRESTVEPQVGRLLADVCDELLAQAQRYSGVGA